MVEYLFLLAILVMALASMAIAYIDIMDRGD